jgi:hypothetical protein
VLSPFPVCASLHTSRRAVSNEKKDIHIVIYIIGKKVAPFIEHRKAKEKKKSYPTSKKCLHICHRPPSSGRYSLLSNVAPFVTAQKKNSIIQLFSCFPLRPFAVLCTQAHNSVQKRKENCNEKDGWHGAQPPTNRSSSTFHIL